MFFSLLSALAIEWFMVSHGKDIAGIPLKNQVSVTRLSVQRTHEIGFHTRYRSGRHRTPVLPQQERMGTQRDDWKVVVIGASTGGIEALIEVLSHFPANAPPTVIVQHINAAFIPGLAQRLDRLCAANVRAARSKDRLIAGEVLLAPGEEEHLVITAGGRQCELQPGPPQHGHRPSVDALFQSAAHQIGADCVGILLSGMGCDGARGLLEIRNQGGWTIAQDEATCTVYGMPRAAVEIGGVHEQLPHWKISQAALKAAAMTRQKVQNA